jgi:signal transduction histidine kinase/CheY-like chemotaxis protein
MSASKLPGSPAALQQTLLLRVMYVGFWLSFVAVAGYAAVYLQRGQRGPALIEAAGAAVLAIGYALALRRREPLLGVQFIAVVDWLLLAVIVTLGGGLRSPAVAWILLLAPLVMLAGGRLALVLTIATVLLVGGLYAAETASLLPAAAEVPLAQRAVSAALIATLFAVFAAYALRWRNQLAGELSAARDAAIEANRLKDRFIANLNHEIRTPLNALVAGARLLERQPLAEEPRALAQAMQRSAEHLLALVNDVLDHARLEAGAVRLAPQPFSVRELARGALEIFRAAAQDKRIVLELELDPTLHDQWLGEPTRLRQVLGNLLSNAIKFTPPQGRVGLRVGSAAAADGDSALSFEVLDDGPGIDAQAQARLFQPYEQGDASISRRYGGTGLGLAICRELLRLMQGTIEVDSMPGGGSRFRVVVPLPRTEETAPGPAGTPAAIRRDLTVLLVEDDATNRLVMEAVLRSLGVQVVSAGGGDAALVLLEQAAVGLVLMDCQMPEVDGLTATRRWRTREAQLKRPRVPVIALTGETQAAARLACVDAGMDDYLLKPATVADVGAALARWAPAELGAAAGCTAHPAGRSPLQGPR